MSSHMTVESVNVTLRGRKRRFDIPCVAAAVTVAVVALAFGVGGTVAAVFLAGRVADLENKVDALTQQAANASILLAVSAVPPPGYELGGSLNAGAGEWAPSVHLPEERSDLQAVACAGRIFLLGGLNASGHVQANVWTFDPVDEVFEDAPSMPTGRYRFAAACLNGHVYVAGGYHSAADGEAGACVASVDRYDVVAETWGQVASLSLARGDLGLAATNGRLYAIGGYGYGYPFPDAAHSATEVFQPEMNAWAAAAAMPNGGKGDITAVALGDTVYVPGGWSGVFSDQLLAYSPATDSWATLPSMSSPRGDKAAVALDGRLYVIGGETWSGKSAPCSWDASATCDVNQVAIHAVEQFSPAAGAWTLVSPLPEARFRAAAAAARGAIYVFGGHAHGERAVNTAWSFHYLNHPDAFFHVREAFT